MNERERMVVSAHLDGEVEAPWKDQVEQRIASDPTWSVEAALQARVKAVLAAAPEPDFSAAQARVHEALTRSRVGTAPRPLPLSWLSVAAAALVVLAGAGGYLWGRASVPSAPAELAELQVQVPKQLELQLSGEGQIMMASTLEGFRR
jgi:anti-sigma factor RsiW